MKAAQYRVAERRSPRPETAFALILVLALSRLAGATAVADTQGKVLFLRSGSYTWAQVSRGQMLNPGDQLRTATSARAVVQFDDGSRVELNPGTSFVLKETTPQQSEVQLSLGSLRAWVNKSLSRKFQVKTPTAVAAVRGTEFSVEVGAGGETRVQMFSGLLAVSDAKGNEVLLRDTQSVDVGAAGLGKVSDPQQGSGGQDGASAKELAKREVGLEMTKEEVQAAAALEQKNAVYQEGKALIDVNGNRVRLEEYIVRPAADQFKLVVLNERADRFDYFFYKGTFNKALPEDMSVALRQLGGCMNAACEYYLTSYGTGRSNTIDKVIETATGGHPVDVNNNGVSTDDVQAAFDPVTDQYVSVALGTPYFKTLFDNYNIAFNGVTHYGWSPSGASGGSNIQNMTTHITKNEVTIVRESPSCAPPNCTYTEEGSQHHVVYASSNDGLVWEKYDNYIISDEGKIASTADFAGVGNSNSAFKAKLLDWNYQQIITASEFQGRKIDLVVEPKILIKSGLIP